MTRILVVIDHLGPGGAQRQVVALIRGLVGLGLQVDLMTYRQGFDFFEEEVPASVGRFRFETGGGFSWKFVRYLRGVIVRGNYRACVSYLDGANAYLELARIGVSGSRFYVSERSSYKYDHSKLAGLAKRALHFLADHVFANSYSQVAWLNGFPWLRAKVSYLPNGIEDRGFALSKVDRQRPFIVAVGRPNKHKNPLVLMRAIRHLIELDGVAPRVHWFGPRSPSGCDAAYSLRVSNFLEDNPEVEGLWEWHSPSLDWLERSRGALALVSCSECEGSPNVVLEAMASGLPVLMSDVCDARYILDGGRCGVLFENDSAHELAMGLKMLWSEHESARLRRALAARRRVLGKFSNETMLGHFQDAVLHGLLRQCNHECDTRGAGE